MSETAPPKVVLDEAAKTTKAVDLIGANLPATVGEIGIPFVSHEEVIFLEAQLSGKLKRTLRTISGRYWAPSEGGFLMRASGYYLACPPYVFPTTDRVAVRAADALSLLQEFLSDANALHLDADSPARRVIASIFDNFKNIATHISDAVFRREVIENRTVVEFAVDRWLDDLFVAYWSYLAGGELRIPEDADWISALWALDALEPFEVTMRELDDQRAIFDSCFGILENAASDDIKFEAVCDFVSGGIELGPSLRALSVLMQLRVPDVFHAVYSSKGDARDPRVGRLPGNRAEFLRQLPPRYRDNFSQLLEGSGALLLYDNNVTTFKTLEAGKRSLERINVYAAAVHIHRGNLEATLSGDSRAEGLVAKWGEVLDFPPIGEYVTAFSTWGSSSKTRELHLRFGTLPVQANVSCIEASPVAPLKACRVHNLTDLSLLYAAGVRSFGVHAVATDRETYDRVQSDIGGTLSYIDPTLPVASGELQSIRHMMSLAPDDCEFVVVIERPLSEDAILEILRLYGMTANGVSLQLQCMVTALDIERYRRIGFREIVVALGADDPRLIDSCRTLVDLGLARVLLDFSPHQPHLIDGNRFARRLSRDVNRLAEVFNNLNCAVMVAHEGDPASSVRLANDLLAAGVQVGGLDAQNSLEFAKQGWRYRIIDDCPQLVRKSPEKVERWARAIAVSRGSSK